MTNHSIETCILETQYQPLVVWSKKTLKQDGIVVPDLASGLLALHKHFNCDTPLELREYTTKTDFVVYGAWVEVCLLHWVELMLGVYNARNIEVDLTRSYSKLETDKYQVNQVLTPMERAIMLQEYSEPIKSSNRVKFKVN